MNDNMVSGGAHVSPDILLEKIVDNKCNYNILAKYAKFISAFRTNAPVRNVLNIH